VRVLSLLALIGLWLVGGCDRDRPGRAAESAACLADVVGALTFEDSVRKGCDAEDTACRLACGGGDGEACLARAYHFERERPAEAAVLFRRSCALGNAVGCTNHAALLWAEPKRDTDLACAQRLFEKACAAKEPFGCGMRGRLLIEGNDRSDETEQGRKILVGSCQELRGFPCRILAALIEDGKLGSPDPARVQELLRRACDGGDLDACGDHATANETFHPVPAPPE